MLLSLHPVAVDFRMEGIVNLPRGARYVYRHSIFVNQVDLQPMRAQPVDNRVDVRLRRAKPFPQLAGCQPFAIIRRVRVV